MPTTDAALATAPRDASALRLERFRMFIDGAWCDAESGQTFETKNPFTGQA